MTAVMLRTIHTALYLGLMGLTTCPTHASLTAALTAQKVSQQRMSHNTAQHSTAGLTAQHSRSHNTAQQVPQHSTAGLTAYLFQHET